MDTKNLQILMQVVRHGSFAAAARELNVDPSSISRAVAAVESDIGTRLFVRNTRQLALTEAGSVFTERLSQVLDELEQAQTAAVDTSGEVRGRLRVTAANALAVHCLSPLLPAFCKAHPALEVELVLGEAPLELVAERVDVALRAGNLRDSSLVAVPLLQIHHHVVASPDWLREQRKPLRQPQQLAAIPCLSFALLGFRDRWLFKYRAGGETIDVPVRPRLVATNAMLLRDSALAGLGPALLADWMIGGDLRAGTLVDLFPDYIASTANSPHTLWAVYPSRHLPAKVRVFVDFLRDALNQPAT